MKQVRTTIILSAFAVVSLIAALSVYYLAPNEEDSQNELIGEVFYPDFTDPVQASTLKLIVWDGENKETREFDVQKVKQTRLVGGEKKEVELWAIPDHNNYPVESPERLRETAGSVMNVERLSLASNSKEEHERLGVFDPTDEKAKLKEANQIGDRIILKDDSGNTVCDLIIGNAVDAEAENEIGTDNRELVKGERYYVRQPDQNETYVAELNLQITTEFSEWIDDDLLQVKDANLSKIQFLNYEVESQLIEKFGGRVPVRQNFEEFVVQKNGFNWSIDDLKSDTEELDSAPLNSLESQLKSLSILEVEPKPTYQDNDMKILNADLSVNAPPGMSPGDRIRIQQQVLGPQGFIIGLENDKKVTPSLLSTNGELKVATDDGLVYHLFFGYDVKMEGDSLEFAAANESAADKDAKDKPGNENAESKSDADKDVKKGKIMSVYVSFDPSLIEKPEKPIKPVPPPKPDLSQIIPANPNPAPDPNKPGPSKSEPEKEKGKVEPGKDESKAAPSKEKNEEKKSAPAKSEVKKAADNPAEKDSKGAPKEQAKDKSGADSKSKESPKKEDSDKKSDSNCGADFEEDNDFPVAVLTPQEKDKAKSDEPSKAGKQEEEKKEQEPAKKRPVPPGPDLDPQETVNDKNQEAAPPMKSPAQVFEEKMQAYNQAMQTYQAELESYNQQMKDYEQQVKDYEKKIEGNRKKVEDLNSRFADWFYIVDAADLEKVKLNRAAIVKPKTTPTNNQPPTGLPPNFNLPGGIPTPNLNNLPGKNPANDMKDKADKTEPPKKTEAPKSVPPKDDSKDGVDNSGKKDAPEKEDGEKSDPKSDEKADTSKDKAKSDPAAKKDAKAK